MKKKELKKDAKTKQRMLVVNQIADLVVDLNADERRRILQAVQSMFYNLDNDGDEDDYS